jgi:hypothetical protein
MKTMPTPQDDDICKTCGKTFAWHRNNPMTKHPFNSGQDGSTDFLKRRGERDHRQRAQGAQEGSQTLQMAGDPVLRIALINRGILTPADLVVAEMQLRDALLAVQREGNDAEPTEGPRRG